MKIIRFAPLLTLLILLNATLAHANSVQVTYNTNLRAAPSLQGKIIETVAAGATLRVIGSSEGWLRINHNGNEVWMSKSVSYTRVEGGESAAPRTSASVQIDNCCFVDRQCTTDDEWASGYRAFQNNQCNPPTGSNEQATSEGNNNCCYLGWQCSTNRQWTNGYWAFQNNQCNGPEHATQPQLQQSSQQQQIRQQQQSRPEQQNPQQQQNRQQQQSPQQQQETTRDDPSDDEPSGDLIFERLTEEEWRKAYCEIYGSGDCDDE